MELIEAVKPASRLELVTDPAATVSSVPISQFDPFHFKTLLTAMPDVSTSAISPKLEPVVTSLQSTVTFPLEPLTVFTPVELSIFCQFVPLKIAQSPTFQEVMLSRFAEPATDTI